MGLPGPGETIIILFIILLLFGGKRLPELARSLGSAMNEFRKAQEGLTGEGGKPKKKKKAG